MNTKRWVALLALITSAAVLPNAAGSITGVEFPAGPPGTLGGYTMIGSFTVPGSEGGLVDSFSFLGGRTVFLDPSLTLYQVGSGWSTWSNAYVGPVLKREVDVLGSGGESILLTLPSNTLAFYLYVEPNFYDLFKFDITANSEGGAVASFSSVLIQGFDGAAGFGFYTNDALDPLDSVSVTIVGDNAWMSEGFAIGQFGIDGTSGVPDGGATAVLLGFAALALVSLRRALSR